MCLSLKPFFESWIIYSASFQFLEISEKLMHSLEFSVLLFGNNKHFLQQYSHAVIKILQHLHNITGNATTRADLCSFVTVMPDLSCLSVCRSAQWFKLRKSLWRKAEDTANSQSTLALQSVVTIQSSLLDSHARERIKDCSEIVDGEGHRKTGVKLLAGVSTFQCNSCTFPLMNKYLSVQYGQLFLFLNTTSYVFILIQCIEYNKVFNVLLINLIECSVNHCLIVEWKTIIWQCYNEIMIQIIIHNDISKCRRIDEVYYPKKHLV